jgi:hypothetical protein
MNVDEHGVCCYDSVGADSKTLVHFVLFCFILLVCVSFFFNQKIKFSSF